ncbi:SIR2 family protein [Bacillus safensis]|uniref:SIR2 family NAD-dependent protein deacylase n=2 Tax=Bacillus safensis TaxID=561879 RepID=UPI00227DAA64|nr:SIR2 family protein [Bacillus safensis]MCY7566295.1 SIR2 family protein [Bacillus safensis]MCY7624577.1 SIR2 family protein [Bacillus safensis]MCY7631656.1 SIR2 family protein [Bacillus safensis]MCY7647921.1 SIR2 family protein [Bacillus safensis]MCY7653318.1 SIR2 family protein [Bacillus safensis]
MSEGGLMREGISKKLAFEKLFNAFNYGNLGMFIGAGFSKAVIGDNFPPALGWFELIKEVSKKFEIEFPNDNELIGVSLPELATLICKRLAIERSIDYIEAKGLFKKEICNLSNWLPSEERTKEFREILDILSPSWIVTTNYDLVLETILTGKSKSLSPMNYLSAPKNIIPVYHLHGTRLDSESIIITQEDYIPLFRPNEYRQAKLAMTIRESTTLVLGYGLGDVNVLSAVDWSKNIYTEENEYPYEIIQALWTSSPKEEAYKDENGNIIIEISDLEEFLNELIVYIVNKQEEYDKQLIQLSELIGRLEGENEEFIQSFIDEKEVRLKLIDVLSRFEHHMISPYIQFLTVCMDKVWEKTSENGAFNMYDKYLNIILDVIVNYNYKKMSPRLFQIIAQSLDRVLYYVSANKTVKVYGDSWDATDSWHIRKKDIPEETINQLYHYSKQNILSNLRHRLKDLVKED